MGEFELLARLRERLPPGGPRLRLGSGDDAAITVPEGATATSVDALIEGVHFRREQSSLAQIGRKALAVALSDLAAMGAEPGEAYIVLGIPSDLGEDGCIELLDGISELAVATGTSIAGGDLTRAPSLALAVTVVGHASSADRLVTRAGAEPGDVLVITGEIGGAAAGLLLLERSGDPRGGGPSESGAPGAAAGLVARQLEPQPRLAEGRALAAAGATAMIDLSDGIGGDATRLSEASGVALRIEGGALPVASGVREVAAAAAQDVMQLAVSGGEDYELLAALPESRLDEAIASVEQEGRARLTPIGAVAAGEGAEIRLPDGRLLKTIGFDQLGPDWPPAAPIR
jgi:thiamine-monophosphate kinase